MGVDPTESGVSILDTPHSTVSYTLLTVAQLVERGTVIGKTAAAIPRSVVRVHPGRPTFNNHRVRMAEQSKALV